MGSRKKKGLYRRNEAMTEDEVKNSPGVNSVARLFFYDDTQSYIFNYLDGTSSNGEMASSRFTKVCMAKDFTSDPFNETVAVQPVRILRSDGEWETGFRWWEDKPVVLRKNGRLCPYYYIEGVYNEKTKEIENMHEVDQACRIPAWTIQNLPYYNERIRDGLKNGDPCIQNPAMTFYDFTVLDNVFRNGLLVSGSKDSGMKMKRLELEGMKEKRLMPTKTWLRYPGTKMRTCHPISVRWGDDMMTQTNGNQYATTRYFISEQDGTWHTDNKTPGCSMIFDVEQDTICYSYFKSIYEDVVAQRRIYHIIPMSDLLNITTKPYGSAEEKEVWNNLDQTVIGNI